MAFRKVVNLTVLVAALPGTAQTPTVHLDPWVFHRDFSQASLPVGMGRLGLAGFSLLRDGPGGFYLGPSLQAALRGERGGFFAAGLEGGLRAGLTPRLSVDGALFLGGGGGWSAPVGGGLMLRPRLGLVWEAGAARLGLGLAHLRFPNGEIRSTQAYVTWERRFSTLRLTSLPTGAEPWWPAGVAVHLEPESLELHLSRYENPAGFYPYSRGDRSPTRELLGVTWRHLGQGPFFYQVAASAAARGGTAGYMEVLGGVGARRFLDSGQRWALRATLSAGSGGGGGIGTGGGFLVKAEAGLQYQVTPALHLFLEAGRVAAPSVPLRATTFSVGTGFTLGSVTPGRDPDAAPVPEPSALQWRVSSGFQRYASVPRRQGEPAGPLEQFAFKGEVLLTDSFYLTAQSAWATGGGAGAWATGFLGLGAQTPAFHGHRLRVELAAGGGGGGGVESQGGALVQALAGWNWDASRSWGIHCMGGRVRAPQGGLSTSVLELGLSFRGIHPVVFR